MIKTNIMYKTITLAYFSGTGCTKAIVQCFEKQLIKLGINVKTAVISVQNTYKAEGSNLLIIFSPVYAFRLASIVEDWVKKLPITEKKPVVVISVSGGGDISPNTACRVRCNYLLKRKGYHLIYEKMLVMPSNFFITAEQQLNFALINIIPKKAEQTITDILSKKKNVVHPKLQDRFLASIGRVEHFGARFFGAFINASSKCNQCGLCIQNCPKKNIQMKNGKPKFGFSCIWCLKCIYNCPRKALSPRLLKFVILKKGFNLKEMSEKAHQCELKKKYKVSNRILWDGVTKYLNE